MESPRRRWLKLRFIIYGGGGVTPQLEVAGLLLGGTAVDAGPI